MTVRAIPYCWLNWSASVCTIVRAFPCSVVHKVSVGVWDAVAVSGAVVVTAPVAVSVAVLVGVTVGCGVVVVVVVIVVVVIVVVDWLHAARDSRDSRDSRVRVKDKISVRLLVVFIVCWVFSFLLPVSW
jgi:Mn2+/Fe2+ NRAMP family transporter